VTFLLLFVSGVPWLENKNKKLYANNEEYKKYCKNTRLLVPLPILKNESEEKKKKFE
jgi:steroid 5-alpha reductase family enzyme